MDLDSTGNLYPVAPGGTTRTLLLKYLDEVTLPELDRRGPSFRAHYLQIREFRDKLEAAKGQHHAFYEERLRELDAYLAVRGKKQYAIQQVSDRKHVVVAVDTSGTLGIGYATGDYKREGTIPLTTARLLSKRVAYGVALKLYAHLIETNTVPDELKKHLLTEGEDEE